MVLQHFGSLAKAHYYSLARVTYVRLLRHQLHDWVIGLTYPQQLEKEQGLTCIVLRKHSKKKMCSRAVRLPVLVSMVLAGFVCSSAVWRATLRVDENAFPPFAETKKREILFLSYFCLGESARFYRSVQDGGEGNQPLQVGASTESIPSILIELSAASGGASSVGTSGNRC